MSSGIEGQRVLVTGAAAGIGRATAELFAGQGARVTALDRTWRLRIPGVSCIEGDVTSDVEVADATARAAGPEGLDVVVANAGVFHAEEWCQSDLAIWQTIFDVNVFGVMRCFLHGARDMIAHDRRGRLLATASTSGFKGDPAAAAYFASKASVVSVVKSAAIALAQHGIVANAVAPGEVETDMIRRAHQAVAALADTSGPSPDLTAELTRIPARRRATVSEVADVFLFLAASAPSYMTGITIPVDGGFLST